jgi:hypothetical protein
MVAVADFYSFSFGLSSLSEAGNKSAFDGSNPCRIEKSSISLSFSNISDF